MTVAPFVVPPGTMLCLADGEYRWGVGALRMRVESVEWYTAALFKESSCG